MRVAGAACAGFDEAQGRLREERSAALSVTGGEDRREEEEEEEVEGRVLLVRVQREPISSDLVCWVAGLVAVKDFEERKVEDILTAI